MFLKIMKNRITLGLLALLIVFFFLLIWKNIPEIGNVEYTHIQLTLITVNLCMFVFLGKRDCKDKKNIGFAPILAVSGGAILFWFLLGLIFQRVPLASLQTLIEVVLALSTVGTIWAMFGVDDLRHRAIDIYIFGQVFVLLPLALFIPLVSGGKWAINAAQAVLKYLPVISKGYTSPAVFASSVLYLILMLVVDLIYLLVTTTHQKKKAAQPQRPGQATSRSGQQQGQRPGQATSRSGQQQGQRPPQRSGQQQGQRPGQATSRSGQQQGQRPPQRSGQPQPNITNILPDDQYDQYQGYQRQDYEEPQAAYPQQTQPQPGYKLAGPQDTPLQEVSNGVYVYICWEEAGKVAWDVIRTGNAFNGSLRQCWLVEKEGRIQKAEKLWLELDTVCWDMRDAEYDELMQALQQMRPNNPNNPKP